jgi:hypothetical protein
MSDLHLSCDTGAKGALCALSPVKGVQPISLIPMPMYRPTKESPPQLDVRKVVDWVLEVYPKGDVHVWIERCPYHMPTIGTMRSVAIAYGRLLGLFEARFPHMIVHRVDCGQIKAGWQRSLFGTFDKTNSKQKALDLAQTLWPEMQWPTFPQGKIHDGCVDAALMGEFGRRKLAGEPMPAELA